MAYLNDNRILFSPHVHITKNGNPEADFEAGRQAERVEQWDNFTNNGKRTDFSYAFFGWGNEYITPTTKITPTNVNSGNQTFSSCPNLKKVEKKYFDFSQKPKGANNQQAWLFTFSGCPNLTIIEDIGMQADYEYRNTFAYNQKLKTIEVIRTDEDTKWSSGCFNNCTGLESVTIAGTIGQSGFDIHYSTKLSKASILSILNACNINVNESPVTITLPSKCIDGATDTKTLLESLGGNADYAEDMENVKTLQLRDTNIIPNSVMITPVDDNGNQTNATLIDDGNGNIIHPDYPEDANLFGTINYETGIIEFNTIWGSELWENARCQYSAESIYIKVKDTYGYTIAFA